MLCLVIIPGILFFVGGIYILAVYFNKRQTRQMCTCDTSLDGYCAWCHQSYY